ncbi:MAG TPA: O-antigen ligase family protein [bacterium]|nr:O-antigen ligase family protein [bacterium]
MALEATLSIRTRAWWRWLAAIGALQFVAGVAAARYGWPLGLAPLAALALLLPLLYPRLGLFLLMAAMFSKHPLPGTDGIYVSDVLSVPLMAGAIMNRLASTTPGAWRRNPLFAPLAALAVYFGLTVVWAPYTIPALINWARHLQLIALTLIILDQVAEEDIGRILLLMLAATIVISLSTIAEFVASGGRERVFGPAGWFFNTFLSMAMIHASVGAIVSARRSARLWWIAAAGISFLGLIATQTRSAMLQALLGIIVVVVSTWIWSRRRHVPKLRRRIVVLVAVTTAMILIFLFGQIVLFETASQRVEQAIEGRSNTIFIRLLLWKMGWAVFTDSPIFGVGLGQASRWSDRFDFFHLDPASPRAGGLGVHNDAITYLAETGIIGTFLILWMFWRLVKMGWELLGRARDEQQLRALLILAGPVGAIICHYFYSAYLFYSIGGMVVSFYFGMMAKMYVQRVHSEPPNLPARVSDALPVA